MLNLQSLTNYLTLQITFKHCTGNLASIFKNNTDKNQVYYHTEDFQQGRMLELSSLTIMVKQN